MTESKSVTHTPGPWHAELNTVTRCGGPRISADGHSPKSLAVADLWGMEGYGTCTLVPSQKEGKI